MSWGPTLLLKGFIKMLVFGKQRIRSCVLNGFTNVLVLLKQRVRGCVSLLSNSHPYQSKTKIWLFVHMFYVSSGWMLVKAMPYLWVVYVAVCISVLCMCASLASMFISAAGWACKQESSSWNHCMDGIPRYLGSLSWDLAAGKEVLQAPESTRASVYTESMSQQFW